MSAASAASAIDELLTVRDWLRLAVSRFNAAGLAYGHGTSRALDEAAFLILEALRLPIDQLEPWLDARLTRAERLTVAGLIDARVTTRKPAAYLLNAAYIQGHRFYVDERTIVPRSFIGEIIAADGGAQLEAIGLAADEIGSVLDMCTGSGCLAILAALAFPSAGVDAADVSADALAVARRNVADYGLAARVSLVESDLFAGLGQRRYDLIICNPPYVTAAAVAAFPPEHKAEPVLAHLGGADGLDVVRRLLQAAGDHLTDTGMLLVEIGAGRTTLEAACPELPFLWLDTEESEGEVLMLRAPDLAARRSGKPARQRKRG